jgi:hypothetical protein
MNSQDRHSGFYSKMMIRGVGDPDEPRFVDCRGLATLEKQEFLSKNKKLNPKSS